MKATIEKSALSATSMQNLFVVSRVKTWPKTARSNGQITLSTLDGMHEGQSSVQELLRRARHGPSLRKGPVGQNGTRVITGEDNWRKPIRWNREAKEKGIRYKVFCASLADVLRIGKDIFTILRVK